MHQFPLHEVQVDAAAITHNIRRLVASNATGTIAVDVRADGYGHGVAEAARAAEVAGAGLVLVSTAVDAAALRTAGIRVPASVVSGENPSLPHGVNLVPTAAAYGLADDERWRPAMRVVAKVIGVKAIGAGEGVSYGYTFRAERDTNLALVAIGYANGVDRLGSNVGSLWLRGSLRPIAGRIAMNALVVDVGADRVEVGDVAVVFGDRAVGEPSIAEWSGTLGKRPTEVAANLGARLPRSYT